MVELLSMLVLAVVQGLTEFLPVSSSGHLVLMQRLLDTREGDVFFDIVLHLGTLGSVLVVYRRDVLRLLRLDAPARGYVFSLALGTLPAVAVGLLARDFVERVFHSPVAAACGLLATAVFLFSTRWRGVGGTAADETWQPQALPPGRVLLVGCAQALAILPGISRSGSTITAGLWLGVNRAEAARFSFLLSIPAILGALLLQFVGGDARTGIDAGEGLKLLLSAIAAFGVGLLAIRWTTMAVVQAYFWRFSIYCLVLGLIALLILN